MVGYESGMVLIWDIILYSWFGNDALVWISHVMRMRMDCKGWHEIYTCMINITCLIMIGL